MFGIGASNLAYLAGTPPPPVTPTLTAIARPYGTRTGGSTHTVTGANFASGDVVKIGGVACTTTFVSTSQLTVTAANWVTNAIQDSAHDVTLWRGGVLQSTLTNAFFTWHPLDYSFNLALLPEGITQSGGVVTGWTNEGSGASLTPTVVGSPAYSAADSLLHGRPSAAFSGSSQALMLVGASPLVASANVEVFQVFYASSMAGNPTFLSAVPTADGTDYAAVAGIDVLYALTTTSLEDYRNGSIANTGTLTTSAPNAIHNRWVSGSPNDTSTVRVNGTEASGVRGHQALSIQRILLGGRWIGSSVNTFAAYRTSLLLMLDGTLSSGNRTVVLSFIGWMFGVTA